MIASLSTPKAAGRRHRAVGAGAGARAKADGPGASTPPLLAPSPEELGDEVGTGRDVIGMLVGAIGDGAAVLACGRRWRRR